MRSVSHIFGACAIGLSATMADAADIPSFPPYGVSESCVQAALYKNFGTADLNAGYGARSFSVNMGFYAPATHEEGEITANVFLGAANGVEFLDVQVNRRDPDGMGMDAINNAALDYHGGQQGVLTLSETISPYAQALAEAQLLALDANMRECGFGILAPGSLR